MTLLIALTISIGVLAVLITWLFLSPGVALTATFNMQVWQAFIAWASHYHNGGKTDGIKKTIICMSWGAVVGMGAVMLAGQLGALGPLAAPVAVGIGAAIIVLAAHLPILSTIPSAVYGFGCVAGLILLGKDMTPLAAIVPTILSIIVGACFGWVSEFIAGKMVKS